MRERDASTHFTRRSRGAGFVAWRFGYQNNSTYATREVYSLPDASNWEATAVYPTSYVDGLHGGGLSLSSGNWILIRYSVAGLTPAPAARSRMFRAR